MYGLKFFIFLVLCIFKEFDEIKLKNKVYYVLLMLLMVNWNKLIEDMFSEDDINNKSSFNEMKCKFL